MQEGALILAVDDTEVDLKLLERILRNAGYQVITGRDGDQALALYQQHRPELVLLDISMPGLGGFDVARTIRDQGASHYEPPIIFITAANDEDLMERCIDAGGNDFLSKPFQRPVLLARIESYLRLARAHQEQREYQKDLEYYQALLEREQVVAQSILESVLRVDQLNGGAMRTYLSPGSVFDGDLVLSAKSPGGHIYLLAGDFPGHGLSASIGSLPTAEIFFTMTAKGFELIDIIAEINARLRKMLPMDIFLAACLVDIDLSTMSAHVWNGGLPDMLLLRASTGAVEALGSRHMPLSILKNSELDRAMERITLEAGDRIYLFTDGLVQAANQGDVASGLERVTQALETAGLEGGFDAVQRLMEQAEGDLRATLLEYRIEPTRDQDLPGRLVAAQGYGIQVGWRFEIRLDPDALRCFDPRPMLTQLLVEVQGLHEHRERLYTIVAELFSNAVEHGLMGLDSRLKSSPEGFAQYYMERDKRLTMLDEGHVDFRLQHNPTDEGGELLVEVEDSGPGFDYLTLGKGSLETSGFSGRGIGLLRRLSDNVTYFSPGNRVLVSYRWVRST